MISRRAPVWQRFLPGLALFATSFCCGCGSDNNSDPAPIPAPSPDAWLIEADAFSFQFEPAVGDLAAYDMRQIMGSGAALVDLDCDGSLEVVLIAREQAAVLDDYGRSFAETTGHTRLANDAYGMGITAGDFNADGFPDLYLTNSGQDLLWMNSGDGTFIEVSSASGIINAAWGTAAGVADENEDGFPDLFVVNYVDYVPGQWCEDNSGRQEFCGPSAYAGTVDRLYRNTGRQDDQGAPVFEDVTIGAGLASNPGKGLGLACADMTGDGRLDFYVANDMESNHLWVQQHDGTYVDEAVRRGVAFNGLGAAEASMGTVLSDLDGDLREELFLTHLRGESHTMYSPIGTGQYEDVTARTGLATASLQYTGFGVVCADLECDGDLDLVIANGRVQRAPAFEGCNLDSIWCDYAEPNQLFLNDGNGRFAEANAEGGGFTSQIDVSRGLAWGDVDNDGDVDLLLTNCRGSANLYVNEAAPRGNWLIVRLVVAIADRLAAGARITISAGEQTMVRTVAPGAGYLTTSDVRVHFGLGDQESYDRLTVEWPDGMVEEFPGGPVNSTLLLCRGGRILSVQTD